MTDRHDNGRASLFPGYGIYAAWLVAAALLLTLVQGLMRNYGDSEQFPLTRPVTYSVDPGYSPYHALYKWDAIYWGDFQPIFEAAQGYRIDPNFKMYQPDQLKAGRASFVYTPFVAMCVHPISEVRRTPERDLKRAANKVSILNHWMWLGTGAMLLLIATHRQRIRALFVGAFLLHFLLYYPFATALQLTQASIWITFFLVASLLLFQRGWMVAAGIALALGVSIKPHLVVIPILLIFIPGFSRRMLVACFAGIGTAALASLSYAGLQNCLDYGLKTLPILSAGYAYYPNQSINGLLLRLLHDYDPADFNLVAPHSEVKLLSSVFGLGVLGICYAMGFRRPAKAGRAEDLMMFALLIAAGTVASPVCWYHHLAALTGPICVALNRLWSNPEQRTRWTEGLLFASYALTAYYLDTRYLRGFPMAFLSVLAFYGGLILTGLLAWLTREGYRRAGTP